MATNVDQLYLEALALDPEARAELMDRLVVGAAEAIAPEIERAHLEEVRRRIAQIDSGEVQLIPGEQVLTEARAMLNTFAKERQT